MSPDRNSGAPWRVTTQLIVLWHMEERRKDRITKKRTYIAACPTGSGYVVREDREYFHGNY